MVKPSAKPKAENVWSVLLCLYVLTAFKLTHGAIPSDVRFDVTDVGRTETAGQLIHPWKTVVLEAEYGGQWVVATAGGGRQTPLCGRIACRYGWVSVSFNSLA